MYATRKGRKNISNLQVVGETKKKAEKIVKQARRNLKMSWGSSRGVTLHLSKVPYTKVKLK